MPRIPKILLAVISSVFLWTVFLNVAFAEGDKVCSGRISGTTVASNPNAGKLYFDAHPGPAAGDNGVVPGDILGLGSGVSAPGERGYAACVDEDKSLAADEFRLKGWAWSDNVGFVSLHCDDKENLGVACGDYDYGVKVTKADAVGGRTLVGHAWSDLGYLQFGGHAYGAPKVDKDGDVTGYAYASSGIWVKLDGMNVALPGEKAKDLVEGPCKGKPYVCIEVKPSSKPVVADGYDYYEVHMYLKEADGAAELNFANYKMGDMNFVWTDTVKMDQLAGKVSENINSLSKPYAAAKGGVIYKPVGVKMPSDQATGGNGWKKAGTAHYVLIEKVKSFAPTKNYSETTSTKTPVPVNNEHFFTNVITKKVEPNRLILKHIQFDLKNKDGSTIKVGSKNLSPVTHPNNQNGYALEFVPNIEVNPMYVDDLQDNIEAYRGIPFNVTLGTKLVGKLNPTGFKVDFYLNYDKEATVEKCGKGADFDFYFLKGFNGEDLSGKKLNKITVNSLDTLQKPLTLTAIAELKAKEGSDSKESESVDCSSIEGPSLYSVITTNVGKNITYYSAKEPSTTSVVGNPDVVVQGNIYSGSGSPVFTPTHKTQAGGNVGVDVIRNTVNENIRRNLADLKPTAGGTCTVKRLNSDKDFSITCDKSSSQYKFTKIGEENVIYFKGSDVNLWLEKPNAIKGNWALIVEDGRFVYGADVYNKNGGFKLAVASLKPAGNSCVNNNVYILKNVKNLQTNLVSDCSLFSYDGKIAADGLPDWGSISDRVSALDKQLLIEGSVASRNTIGGSEPAKGFVVDGTGKVYELPITEKQRMLVQEYDLNYLRLSKPKPEVINGLIVDQSCQKALTIEDMIQIKEFFHGDFSKKLLGENGEVCDGIDLSEPWDPDEGLFGDVVLSANPAEKASGLSDSDTNPVYVHYVPPYKDSFVFSKSGETSAQ